MPHGTGGLPAWERHEMTTPATPPAQETPAPVVEQPPAQAKPEIDWKAEARKHEARAKENAAAAAKLAELEEAQKTESQKLTDRAVAAEKERDAARLDALRVRVGAAKNLPADMIDRLRGDTEDELSADADRLAAHLKTGVRTDPDMGPRGAAPASTPAQEFASFLQGQLRQT